MVDQAVAYGYKEIAITDRNTLAGIVRAHTAAKKAGIRIIPACRLDLIDGPSLLVVPYRYPGVCKTLSTAYPWKSSRGKRGMSFV